MTNDMNEKDIQHFFENLTPGDFFPRPATVTELPVQPGRDFDTFVQDQLRTVRYAFASADGEVNPLATLASKNVERVYAAEDEETLGAWADRLTMEGLTIGATWLFIFKKTLVGTFKTDVSDDTISEAQAIQMMMNEGAAKEALYWYAADKESGSRVHGYLDINEDGKTLGDVTMGDAARVDNVFARIMKG